MKLFENLFTRNKKENIQEISTDKITKGKEISTKEDINKKEQKISNKELSKILKEELKINKKISSDFTKEELKEEKKKSKEKANEIKLTTKDHKEKFSGQKYFTTNIPGFDFLIKPGIPEGSSVLVEGGPGSGKTLFCLTLLKEQVLKGKKVLYMSFEEPEDRLRNHITNFGINPVEYEKKGLLYIRRFNALDIARSVEALLSEAKKELLIDVQPVLIPKEFAPDIVLIDSLTSISSAFSGESSRFRIYMEQLFRYLEGNNITSFLVREVANPTHLGGNYVEQGEAVSFLSDGIIALYSVFDKSGKRRRALEVVKMRSVSIERKIVEFNLTGKGVIIYPNKILKGEYGLD